MLAVQCPAAHPLVLKRQIPENYDPAEYGPHWFGCSAYDDGCRWSMTLLQLYEWLQDEHMFF